MSASSCLVNAFLSFIFIYSSRCLVSGQPTIVTSVGSIQGMADKDNMINTYLGIPYAKPPTGDRRFRKPEPLEALGETFMATSFGQPCTQGTAGAEDCLYLNIFVPVNASSENPVAVMVWIHGGGFQIDTASKYEGTGLAVRGGVIVVTLNYRLGVLGFLSTEDSSSPGNYGLWDQRLALKWVQKNIGAFGGDPNRVTLIGESAGAASAAYQALSPHSKGLFQRMILQSGTAVSPFALNRVPKQFAVEFAKRVGCVSQDTAALLDCLRPKNLSEVSGNSHDMTKPLASSVIDFTWVPSVDNDFIPDDPNKLIANDTYLQTIGFFDVDLLLGMNNDEGSLVFFLANLVKLKQRGVALSETDGLSRSFFENEFVPAIVGQKFGKSTRETRLATGYMYESGSDTANTQFVTNSDWFMTYADATFLSAITHHATVHARGPGKTYLYLFDHQISYNINPVVTGTPHGGEVPFVFGFARKADSILKYTKEEYDFSMNIITYWTNMAKSGSPNLPVSDLPVQWPVFEKSEQKFLKLSTRMSNASIGEGLFTKRAEFWLDFMPAILSDNELPNDSHNQIEKSDSSKPRPTSAQFIDRFNIDSATAEGTIIALAVVVAILSAVVLICIALMIFSRRKKVSSYST